MNERPLTGRCERQAKRPTSGRELPFAVQANVRRLRRRRGDAERPLRGRKAGLERFIVLGTCIRASVDSGKNVDLKQPQKPHSRVELRPPRLARLRREVVLAPLLRLPVLVDMRGLPHRLRRRGVLDQRERGD